MTMIVGKLIFCSSLHFQWQFAFLKRSPLLTKKDDSTEKSASNKSWKTFNVRPKPNMRNSVYIQLLTFTQPGCFWFLLIKDWAKVFDITKSVKKLRLGGDWDELRAKLCLDNPSQNIWNKEKKSSENRQNKNTLTCFKVIFD